MFRASVDQKGLWVILDHKAPLVKLVSLASQDTMVDLDLLVSAQYAILSSSVNSQRDDCQH